MKTAPFPARASALLCSLLASCGDFRGDAVGCFGPHVDCSSDAPTLTHSGDSLGGPAPGSLFDLAPTRVIAPTWAYDHPLSYPEIAWQQLAQAPAGGVWVLSQASSTQLQRFNAEGEPVESHALSEVGALSVDDELSPVLLSWSDGYIRQTTLGPLGEPMTWTVGLVEPRPGQRLLMGGPEGRVRAAVFKPEGSYLAEYDPLGELLWRQLELRDARDFPFERGELSRRLPASYRMVTLSDGAIALGVPKHRRNDRDGVLYLSEHAQGVTLVEPDGNLRWDRILGGASSSMLLAPGPDGSVVYASSWQPEPGVITDAGSSLSISVIDASGTVTAGWVGRQVSYYDVRPSALCTDADGSIYTVVLTGDRTTPLPTVCRLSASEEEVVCLGLEEVALPRENWAIAPRISGMVAPEPGAVVLAFQQADPEQELSIARLVRVDF